MRPQLFGTLFYANYLTRAMALYGSLERHFEGEFELVMLCMDDISMRICEQLGLRNARVVSIRELEKRDQTLASVKPARAIAEYCWTCVPPLLIYLFDQVAPNDMAVYLDADLMFFSSPQPIFDQSAGADIVIHEHRFAPRWRHLEAGGIFNVGWVGIRNTAEGRKCLARWRAQCIEACTVDPDRGLWGDQKYLDEWPTLYDHLTILRHDGVGLAPWNVERYKLTSVNGTPHVDGMPLIFYHFHGLQILHEDVFGNLSIIPCTNFPLTPQQKRLLYAPYVGALRTAGRDLARLSAGTELPRDSSSLFALAHVMLRADILFVGASGRAYPLGAFIAIRDLLRSLKKRLLGWSDAA